MKQKCDGDMWDWFSLKARRVYLWKAGMGKRIKKRANKRLRQFFKKEIRDEKGEQ
jgi:hypothetical protein